MFSSSSSCRRWLTSSLQLYQHHAAHPSALRPHNSLKITRFGRSHIPQVPLVAKRHISLASSSFAPSQPPRWRKWLCRTSVVLCIVGGYLSYTGASIITEQDLENSMLVCALHMQRVVHSPQFSAVVSGNATSQDGTHPPPTDKEIFKVLRVLIEPWVDVSDDAMTVLFERFESLPPSSGAGNVARKALTKLKRVLAESDEKQLKLMKPGIIDLDEEHMKSMQDLNKTISRIADLLNDTMAALADLVDEVVEEEARSSGSKVLKLDFGHHPDSGQSGDRERGMSDFDDPAVEEKKDYEDVS